MKVQFQILKLELFHSLSTNGSKPESSLNVVK